VAPASSCGRGRAVPSRSPRAASTRRRPPISARRRSRSAPRTPSGTDAARGLRDGTARPRPQDEAGATYFPVPADGDLEIDPGWPARRVFNFVRGVATLDTMPFVRVGGARVDIRDALAWDEGARPDEPVRRAGDRLRLACNPGVVELALASPDR
jgi:methionyl-tRNA formyltransferase